MQRAVLSELERYDDRGKFYRTEVFKSERTRTLLLCLAPGQSVPPHRHEGYDVLLEPLRGEAEITLDGETFALRAGEIILVDGANDFAPVNRTRESFAMLITLIRR